MSVCRLICVEVVQHFVSLRFYVNNTVTMVILPPTLNTLFILCQRKENPWTTRAFRECNCPWSERAILKLWYSIKFLLQHADVSPFLLQYNDVSLSRHSCDTVGRRIEESNNCVVALSNDVLVLFKVNFECNQWKPKSNVYANFPQSLVYCCEIWRWSIKKIVGNIRSMSISHIWCLDLDFFGPIFPKIKPAWAVIGINHHTKFENDIMITVEAGLPTNGTHCMLPPFGGEIHKIWIIRTFDLDERVIGNN